MGRVVITHYSEASLGEFPFLTGVKASGVVQSRNVIATPDRPLCFRMHDLSPSAEFLWAERRLTTPFLFGTA